MTSRVRLDVEGSLALVTLNRPEKHNGMDFEMLDAVVDVQRKIAQRRELRAVIVRGEGPSFCAGLDFKTVLGKPLATAARYTELFARRENTFQTWSMGFRRLGVPVIAAVHGNCFGAGMQLALGADIRIARADAQFSLMEAKWGLVPDMGGPTLLRELVPIDVAKELTLTGRILSGEEAKRLNLVTHLAEDPLAHARGLAEELEQRSPDAVAAGKFLLQEAWGASEAEALSAERRWQRRILGLKNQRISIERNQKKAALPYARRRIGDLS
ncbi:MAG: crotonase/enoyl-CoA hydratase family protein [Myxococcales bacterium]